MGRDRIELFEEEVTDTINEYELDPNDVALVLNRLAERSSSIHRTHAEQLAKDMEKEIDILIHNFVKRTGYTIQEIRVYDLRSIEAKNAFDSEELLKCEVILKNGE